MTIREQILQEALALPPEDRVFVADQIEQSLQHGEFASADTAAAWDAEIERRIAAFDRGEVEALDADTTIGRMRSYLAQRRARNAKS